MIESTVAAQRLAVVRIVVFGVWFIRLATTPVASYALLPSEAVQPVGIMQLLPVATLLSSPVALELLRGAGLVFTAACVLGLRPWRLLGVTAFLLVLWHDGAMKATQAYVNHGQALAMFATLMLAVSPAADAFSVMTNRVSAARSKAYAGGLLACALFATTSYTFVGLRRIIYGGWSVFTDGTIERWVEARSLEYAAYDFRLGAELLQVRGAGAVLVLGMLLATVAEAGAVLILLWRRLQIPWLVAIVGFHVSTLLLMNIFFWENVAILVALFATPEFLERRLREPDAALTV
ncbi:hypothetical protein [Egicoccus sp. AB-alg2]|uniref:hypothetical protein n=1 Tax=Egicoccus sp. AB-alg2 TaxID=3242693 RepID=UPI00359DF76F